ncbi:MAG TPA: response regulator, partial [Ideonella sp.]|nr:response regulator [Ideonella sp.]
AMPVIAISANASGVDKQRALEAGADAFLPKPIDRDELLEEIARRIGLQWVYAGDRPVVTERS